MKTIEKIVAASVILSFTLMIACKKDDDSYNSSNVNPAYQEGTSQVVVRLTNIETGILLKSQDEHPVFDAVNIEIERVAIFYGDTGTSGNWTELETNAGIYDLTDLDNLSVVLADGVSLPPGYVGQLRLILGDSNSVMVDSLLYDLRTPSAQQSGLKVNLDFTIRPDYEYEILLDFDTDKSIVLQGNGHFLLKPVIRVESIIENIPDSPEIATSERYPLKPMENQ